MAQTAGGFAGSILITLRRSGELTSTRFSGGWTCRHCWGQNKGHEAVCYRCKAPREVRDRATEEPSEPDRQPTTSPGTSQSPDLEPARTDTPAPVGSAPEPQRVAAESSSPERLNGRGFTLDARFCDQCGSPRTPASLFCAHCGLRFEPEPAGRGVEAAAGIAMSPVPRPSWRGELGAAIRKHRIGIGLAVLVLSIGAIATYVAGANQRYVDDLGTVCGRLAEDSSIRSNAVGSTLEAVLTWPTSGARGAYDIWSSTSAPFTLDNGARQAISALDASMKAEYPFNDDRFVYVDACNAAVEQLQRLVHDPSGAASHSAATGTTNIALVTTTPTLADTPIASPSLTPIPPVLGAIALNFQGKVAGGARSLVALRCSLSSPGLEVVAVVRVGTQYVGLYLRELVDSGDIDYGQLAQFGPDPPVPPDDTLTWGTNATWISLSYPGTVTRLGAQVTLHAITFKDDITEATITVVSGTITCP